MEALSGKTARLPKTGILVYGLLFALFTVVISPFIAHAEEPPVSEAPSEVSQGVESPGAPNATFQTGSTTIAWAWAAPAGGLTPDADATVDNPEQPAPENPTDIIKFGYEFSKDGVVIVTPGFVESSVLKVDTTATEDGEYVFKVWSVARSGEVSVVVSGTVAFVAPIPEVSELPPIVVPAPIDISPVKNNPVSNGTSLVGGSTGAVKTESSKDTSAATISNALLPSPPDKAVAGAATAALVKPSSQGWVIFGLAWYYWLIILVGIFIIGRLIMGTIYRRQIN